MAPSHPPSTQVSDDALQYCAQDSHTPNPKHSPSAGHDGPSQAPVVDEPVMDSPDVLVVSVSAAVVDVLVEDDVLDEEVLDEVEVVPVADADEVPAVETSLDAESVALSPVGHATPGQSGSESPPQAAPTSAAAIIPALLTWPSRPMVTGSAVGVIKLSGERATRVSRTTRLWRRA